MGLLCQGVLKTIKPVIKVFRVLLSLGGVLGARRGLAANVSISWGTVCGRPGGMTPPKPPCPSLGLNVVWH